MGRSFKVLQKVGNLAYRLEMNLGWRIHPVFHVSLLKPYHSDGHVQPPPIPIELEGHLEYEVECILDHRFSDKKRQKLKYLISWKGYGLEHNSWEPEANVANAPDLIGEYWQRIGRAAGVGAYRYKTPIPVTHGLFGTVELPLARYCWLEQYNLSVCLFSVLSLICLSDTRILSRLWPIQFSPLI
jgi:hypothetical protein